MGGLDAEDPVAVALVQFGLETDPLLSHQHDVVAPVGQLLVAHDAPGAHDLVQAPHGHQVVVHWVGEEYRAQDYVNPVDGDEVPVPHFGLQMPTYELWKDVVDRVKAAGIPFIIEPTLRFEGAPGEQWTCFFKDPSGNNLEFKHMSKPQNLFAKYNVAEG